jgi:hypothetical protein
VDPQLNPFSVLSWIVAPALLTNASALLILSTANRLARAVDRAQELSSKLEDGAANLALGNRRSPPVQERATPAKRSRPEPTRTGTDLGSVDAQSEPTS